MTPTTNGRPGVGTEADQDVRANTSSVGADTPTYVTPGLDEMTPHGQTIALEWYGLGYRDGHARGYQAAQDDMAALQRRQVQVARQAAQAGPYSALCDLRGDREGAQRARAHEQRIAAMPSPTERGGWVA